MSLVHGTMKDITPSPIYDVSPNIWRPLLDDVIRLTVQNVIIHASNTVVA